MESLDERCLLSTGVGLNLPHQALQHVAAHAVQTRTTISPPHLDRSLHRSIARPVRAGLSLSRPGTEKPAGSLTTGAATSFDPIVGASSTRSAYGVNGSGMTVAVIDTGVDYDNPALGGGFGSGYKVIAGYNFATDTSDPKATSSQHGTAVAGLIGSTDPNHQGVAPGVNIVALKVVGDNNTADLGNVARALQWVVDNHTRYHITVVNMSLSDGGNYAHNWFAHDGGVGQQITTLIGDLKQLNIPVVAATGNSFNGQQGEGFTSIVSDVISVTATDSSDHLLSDAQRLGPSIGMGTQTEVAAPGSGMIAPSGDHQLSSVQGTSFATPLVSGAVVLLQQIYEKRFGSLPTVDQLTQWLEKGSDPIHDPVTGITLGRLDIPKAAALIPATTGNSAPSVPVTVPNPPTTGSTTPSQPTSGTPGQPPAGQELTPPGSTGPSTPSTPPTSSTGSTTISNASKPRVFVNGHLVSNIGSATSSQIASLNQSAYNSLLRGMAAWAASGDTGAGGSSQVRIWGASTQVAGGISTGRAFPMGVMSTLRMARMRRLAARR
jgi:type VI secretion system secreted protein VgrG